ncbi:MAG TPA: CsgG/HfaB family protein [Candidatus Methylomirabilis sp.]|nr:CsgG/HfaB family protein [Candidatus Methylomirabilis sp.]
MPVDLLWNRKRSVLFFVCVFLAIFLSSGCAFHYVNQASLDVSQIKEEKIQRIAVLAFDNPPLNIQAGMHISRLFELYLLRTGLYKVAERGQVENLLRERGIMISPAGPAGSLQQLGDLLQVDGIVLGSVSQYSRTDMAFSARLLSVKSGLVLWSVSETGGNMFLPVSRVADRAVRSAVSDLQARLR